MRSRAEAEKKRGEIFDAILNTHPSGAYDEGVLTTQKFNCVMQAHFEDQLRYFEKASAKHAKAAKRSSPLRITGYVLIAAAILVGAIGLVQLANAFGLPVPPVLLDIAAMFSWGDLSRAQLGLGTMASSILAHATARSMLEQDERNAALYSLTARRLCEYLGQQKDHVQVRAAAGDLEAVKKFYQGARQILEAEHTAWFLSRPPSDPVSHTFEDQSRNRDLAI